MKRPSRYLLTYIWTLPYDILTFPLLLLMWLFWGTNLHWNEGVWFEFEVDSWPMRTWYKSWAGTNIGHGGFVASGHSIEAGRLDTEVEFHEHVHTEQFECAMLIGFLIQCVLIGYCLFVSISPLWWVSLILWVLSWPITVCCSMLQAFIRGEDSYRGSVLEEAAYALSDRQKKESEDGH